jgi:thiol-disulfide isomerase/thioredoxin
MIRLAVASEFAKDGEAQAVAWCEKLATEFPQHMYAPKARGIVARLKSEGQTFALTGPMLGSGQNFSMAALQGKAVLVVYWAGWSARLKEDAKVLAELAKTHGPKGLAIVMVSLEDNADNAKKDVAALQLPGVHLHTPGGVDGSPLAVSYGIMGPHAFLIGKDGKVVNKNAQLAVVGDEIEKLLK